MRAGLATPARFTVGWYDAIFEHYRARDATALARWLPPGLELDTFDGAAWVSVVSFRMHAMRWRGLLLPGAHTYPQINVRTYVRSDDKVGVFFLRNHVSNRLAAIAGRVLYGVPYRWQGVEHSTVDGISCRAALPGGVHHVAGRPAERLVGHEDDARSHRFFLVERYPLFSLRGRRTYEAAMLHAPWHLHRLDVTHRTHAIVDDLGLGDALEPWDEVHTSPGVDVEMWPPYALGAMPPLVPRPALPARE